MSGLEVAAMTHTPRSPSTPSSSVRNWFTTRSVTPAAMLIMGTHKSKGLSDHATTFSCKSCHQNNAPQECQSCLTSRRERGSKMSRQLLLQSGQGTQKWRKAGWHAVIAHCEYAPICFCKPCAVNGKLLE
eukprot:1151045-Pelagomonas_calceolata.AAC.5